MQQWMTKAMKNVQQPLIQRLQSCYPERIWVNLQLIRRIANILVKSSFQLLLQELDLFFLTYLFLFN